MKNKLWVLCILLSACGYHTVNVEDKPLVGVPFIQGDVDGGFTQVFTEQLAGSSIADYVHSNYRYEIRVKMDSKEPERVGFKYDRKPDGTLKPNLIGTETRKKLGATVEVFDQIYEKTIWGPVSFDSFADFDYVDSDNVYEMSFINQYGIREQVFSYSLGQLNTIEGAQDAAAYMVYRLLSKKIVDELGLFFETIP
jgi:hypothetical protein